MKKYLALALLICLNVSCNGQNNKEETTPKTAEKVPPGDWKVNKQYDDKGNLIQYDSIYSWSSSNTYNNLSDLEKDSLLHSYKSKFFSSLHSFPTPQDIDSIFMDSFFNDDFFSSDFGEDFMQLDKIRNRMLQQQQQFLKKYSSKVEPKESEKTKL
ncbi:MULTISPECIES: hypothetical protein [Cellulophaga]|uniref:Lipoprotein n=1 Tax=Cellulophaga lytica (strain ATCC 23178 / DSM 7489 / JCM 8516 / NBRC 14961 / NCIMB 1423 / VKM B-1433 / Cy l20) TaxID=867900 RepID=F0RBM8_CELLC|nr:MULTISPECIES: hypothetical protein [Cellulophaga]ADY30678.1 hypothetical protein Celly_2861 [Cellulophaga lytica DSM 7489]AIM61660.1 hypothetical protein IX49_14400 [Cellulophaga lytica]APU11559.1 hypothetical protein A5M85_15085 [Cellulophaga lytica]TVZ10010.1 hypothetical protein JM80_2544 [Cellulophaga sp. RHA_52]WQG78396.1 hypothetical protein SR888_05570 [Cellulophaga lytica]